MHMSLILSVYFSVVISLTMFRFLEVTEVQMETTVMEVIGQTVSSMQITQDCRKSSITIMLSLQTLLGHTETVTIAMYYYCNVHSMLM